MTDRAPKHQVQRLRLLQRLLATWGEGPLEPEAAAERETLRAMLARARERLVTEEWSE